MDAAFKTAAYPGLTNEELKAAVRKVNDALLANGPMDAEVTAKVIAMNEELDRRDRVAAGDVSAMTAGERLRHYKAEAGQPWARGFEVVRHDHDKHITFYANGLVNAGNRYELARQATIGL